MRIQLIFSPLLAMLLLFCVAANKEATVDQLMTQADAVLKGDDATVRANVGKVFAAADRLAQLGKLPEAAHYYVGALKAVPSDYEHHMAYADVLVRQNRQPDALAEAQLVLRGSEEQEVLERARTLAGISRPRLAPLDELPDGKPILVLVPIGDVDLPLLADERQKLRDELGIEVVLRAAPMTMPDADRDPLQQAANTMRARYADVRHHDPQAFAAALHDANMTEQDLLDNFKVTWFCIGLQRKAGQLEAVTALEGLVARGKQWSGEKMLAAFTDAVKPYSNPNAKLIGVTRNDLYSRDSDFIFGLRQDTFAIISYRRFMASSFGEASQRPRLARRLHFQFLASAGHVFGLERCTDPACPRAYPHSVAEQDAKSDKLCEKCRKGFETAFGRTEAP